MYIIEFLINYRKIKTMWFWLIFQDPEMYIYYYYYYSIIFIIIYYYYYK